MRDSAFPIKTIIGLIVGLFLLFLGITYTGTGSLKPIREHILDNTEVKGMVTEEPTPVIEEVPVMQHVKTPENVRGVYVSAYSFMSDSFRTRLDTMIDNTTVNSIVVDIKDAPGTIMFDIGLDTPCVKASLSKAGVESNIKHYHEKGIYVIARIAVFRDECYVKNNLELAVQDKVGNPWRDNGGHYWLAPHEQQTREYIRDIAKAVFDRGFDEIQLDYIRYPSDGNMANLKYEYTDTIAASSTLMEKRRATIHEFVGYMRSELKDIPLSTDIFGMVLTNTDDLTIGQHLDDFVPQVDFISPMIYPSHFPKQWNGIADPNKSPYQTIYDSTAQGLARMNIAVGSSTAKQMMRPWLQDFSLYGVVYNAPEVKAQIKALADLGVQSYILWNASNRYTPGVMNK
ncbi:MAG: hypothetical protein RJB39_162 [Candidatus Parcubacteria bacterium]